MVGGDRINQEIKLKYFPCAKINLGLNVVARRNDGYHNLETVFFPVDIHDELDVNISGEKGCHLEVEGVKELCSPEQNLVVKAYNLLNEKYNLPGITVRLTKRIPSQAGMGRGSSDGAYMIRALNELCSLGLPVAEMQRMAANLGADCPFFITAETAYAEGIGERLTPINFDGNKLFEEYYLVLIKPDVAVSTKEAYAGITPHESSKNCREIVETLEIGEWKNCLVNDFEDSIFPKLPILKEVKLALYEAGAVYASMSGSGSTIYGIFPRETDCNIVIKNNKISQYANKYYFKVIEKQK